MTRRHSLVTRTLALVMALVLIASNGAGLTLGAKAAVTGNLFDLMSKYGASNEKLDAVLAYADDMPELKAMNISVEYEEAPTAAKGTLRQGTLKVEEIGAWLPMSYYLPGSTAAVDFNGEYTVEGLGEDTASVNVVYTQMPIDAAEVQAVQMWVHALAAIPSAQAAALAPLSTDGKLMALGNLKGEFIYGLSADVDAITAENLDITLTAEDLGITNETVLQELGYTQEEIDLILANGIDEETQAKIDAEVQKKIDEEIAKELETVKTEFKGVIEKLLDCLVDEDDPYAVYPDYKGRPGVYIDCLRIYAMLDQYSEQGLPFYYENAADIVSEMESLATVLDEILGEENEDGINYNQKAMNYLLKKGEYPVTVGNLESLKAQMLEGAATLREQEGNLKTVTDKIDVENCSDLKGLLDALAAFDLTGCMMAIFMYSEKLTIVDDSWRFITTTVNGEPVYIKFATDTVLEHSHIASAIAQIMNAAPHHDVDTSAVAALLGAKMTEDIPVECPTTPKTYTVEVVDGEAVKVSGDAEAIVLPFAKNHKITYNVNGVTVVVTDEKSATVAITAEDMNKIAAGEYKVTMVEDVDLSAVNWDNLVRKVNEKIGREALVLTEDTLTANITMKELSAFGTVVFDMGINTILLNGEEFLVNLDNSYIIRIQTLINALMCDTSFTSQKLIDLGTNGSGNLLNSTIEIFESEKNFVLNLPSVPAQMGTVADALNAVKDYMTFQGSGPIQGRAIDSQVNSYLNVKVNLPEKIYEAYVTAALLTGEISDDNVAALNNKIAMDFVADYFDLLINSDANTTTYENTLATFGIEKDLSAYEEYYQLFKRIASDEDFYEVKENSVELLVDGQGNHVKDLLAMLGLDYTEMTMGQDVIEDDEQLHIAAVVNIENDAPKFEALVIDPARLNNAGYKAKIMAANYVTDLTTASMEGPAAIMLLGDVDGDLVIEHTTILDLNGFTVNGSITTNAPLYIVDSSLDTVSGGGVTGSVTGSVTVLAGTYGDPDQIEAYLKDGYYMDDTTSAVMNAMFLVDNGEIIVDGNLYLNNTDGYLPAAHYLAADIAIDMALNYYFAAGFAAEGETLYNISFNDLVDILKNKDVGALVDQTLACFNATGISNFMNTMIADLLDFPAVRDAIKNDTTLASYTFTTYPWSVVPSITEDNVATLSIMPSSEGKSFTQSLIVKVPDGDIKNKIVKALDVLANHVVAEDTKVEVTIDQPKRDGKNILVGGSGTANMTLDFSQDQKYNTMLAGVLAYFNEDVEDELVKEGCIIDLNAAMATVTVGDFFTAVKGVIDNPEITFADMVEKLGISLSANELSKLETLYGQFKVVCNKIINKFDLTTNSTAPLSELANGDGVFTVSGNIQEHTADVFVKGYGIIATLGYTDAKLTVKLAPKCTEIWGDVDSNGVVDTNDAMYILQYVTGRKTADDLHMCVADLDGNGAVDTNDAMYILQFVTGRVTKLPVK